MKTANRKYQCLQVTLGKIKPKVAFNKQTWHHWLAGMAACDTEGIYGFKTCPSNKIHNSAPDRLLLLPEGFLHLHVQLLT